MIKARPYHDDLAYFSRWCPWPESNRHELCIRGILSGHLTSLGQRTFGLLWPHCPPLAEVFRRWRSPIWSLVASWGLLPTGQIVGQMFGQRGYLTSSPIKPRIPAVSHPQPSAKHAKRPRAFRNPNLSSSWLHYTLLLVIFYIKSSVYRIFNDFRHFIYNPLRLPIPK